MKTRNKAYLVVGGSLGLSMLMLSSGMASLSQAATPAALSVETQSAPGFAVENYIHPGAERLGAEHGIKLKDGDGNMILVECDASSDLIRVESIDATNYVVCFRATASPAWLNMEITGSFGVKAAQNPVEVTSTVAGTQAKMTVPGNSSRPVGVADGESVVVQLRTS